MAPSRALALILFVTLFLGILFLSNVPPGYGPDEPSHFGYVKHFAEGRGLPVLGRETDPSGPSYEAHQPPLYYAIAVPFYLIGKGVAGDDGGWWGVRFFTLLCGLGTVALVFLLMRRLFPDEPVLAAGAAMLAGWLPSQAFLFGAVSNDPLTELGFTLSFYLLALYLLGETRKPYLPLLIGLAAGLTFLVKASGLILLAVLPLALLLAPAPPDSSLPRWRPVLLFLMGAAVCMPWILRNQFVYGDPLGWAAFQQYFLEVKQSPTPRTLTPPGMEYSAARYWLDTVLRWAWYDSLGMWLFQPPGSNAPLRVSFSNTFPFAYPLWGLLWLAAVAGAIRYGVTEFKRQSSGWKWVVTAMIASLILLSVAYLRLNAVFFWAHSRYLFPAIAALGFLWSVGLSRVVPPSWRPWVMGGTGALFFILSLFAGFVLLGGFFDQVRMGG